MHPADDGFMSHVKDFYKAIYHVISVILEQNMSKYIALRGHVVAQLVEALRYKPEGRGFDFRWYHSCFTDIILPAAL